MLVYSIFLSHESIVYFEAIYIPELSDQTPNQQKGVINLYPMSVFTGI